MYISAPGESAATVIVETNGKEFCFYLSTGLHDIENWTSVNRLQLNASKTEVLFPA